jgi:nitrile hydratase accessory protein
MQNTHLTLEEIALHCGGQMPLPVDSGSGNGTVFAEPWQAHAFAMTLQLHEKGLFTWPEWAAALTQEISNAQQAGDTDTGCHLLHPLAECAGSHGVGQAMGHGRTNS